MPRKKPNNLIAHEAELRSIQDEIVLLSNMLSCDTIMSSRTDLYDMIKKDKKKYVIKAIGKEPWQQKRKHASGEYYTLWVLKVDGNYVSSVTEDGLYEKVYKRLCAKDSSPFVLNTLFEKALHYKKETSRATDKTLKEYTYVWNRHFRCNPISEKDIREISAAEWTAYFIGEVKSHNLTKKRFNELKTVVNMIFAYLVNTNPDNSRLIPNYVRDINCNDFPFRYENTNKVKSKAFTDGQIKKILKWCREQLKKSNIRPLYPLAIMFNIHLGLRFAEMSGLKWSDIDWDNQTVTIQRQRVSSCEMQEGLEFKGNGKEIVDHTKQHVDPHAIYVPDESLRVLKRIRKLGLSEEYVFPEGSFRYHTYNDKVKKAAVYAGLPKEDFHTHCLRATAATTLYRKSGGDTKVVQYQLRHTTPAMTSKYIDDWWALEAAKKAFSNRL